MASAAPRACPPGIRCLRYENVAPGSAYHAALIAVERPRADGYQVSPHQHDFYELMCVLAGDALHQINGMEAPLRPGDLIFLRPSDWHSVRYRTGSLLHYINIALPASLWERFLDMTGTVRVLDAPLPGDAVAVRLTERRADECARAFRRALERFQGSTDSSVGTGMEACRLLATVVPWLLPSARAEGGEAHGLPEGAPPWLLRACRKLQGDPEALRIGLVDFVAEAGVTRTHLARVLKSLTNQTPTEYINTLRLQRAARLLTTTALPVLDVAGECGFEQPSYFYRRFRAQFGTTPHAYRNAGPERVAPCLQESTEIGPNGKAGNPQT